MRPLLQDLSDSQQKHHRIRRVQIPAQKRNCNGCPIQNRYFDLPSAQRPDTLPDISGWPASNHRSPNRHGQKQLTEHALYHLLHNPVSIIPAYPSSGILPDMIRCRYIFIRKPLQQLDHSFPGAGITDGSVLISLIYFYFGDERLARQIILENIRFFESHLPAGHVNPHPPSDFMNDLKFHIQSCLFPLVKIFFPEKNTCSFPQVLWSFTQQPSPVPNQNLTLLRIHALHRFHLQMLLLPPPVSHSTARLPHRYLLHFPGSQ